MKIFLALDLSNIDRIDHNADGDHWIAGQIKSALPFCRNDHFGIAGPTSAVMPLEMKGGLAASAEDEGDMPKAAQAIDYLWTAAGLKFHLIHGRFTAARKWRCCASCIAFAPFRKSAMALDDQTS